MDTLIHNCPNCDHIKPPRYERRHEQGEWRPTILGTKSAVKTFLDRFDDPKHKDGFAMSLHFPQTGTYTYRKIV